MNKYYILTLISLITSSNFAEAESCKSDPAFQAINDTADSFYYPPEMIGSCAYEEHRNLTPKVKVDIANKAKKFLLDHQSKVANSIERLTINSDRTNWSELQQLDPNAKNISGFITNAKKSFGDKFSSEETQSRLIEAAQAYSKNCVSGDVNFELPEDTDQSILTIRTEIGDDLNATVSELNKDIKLNEKSNPLNFNVYSNPIRMHSILRQSPTYKNYEIPNVSLFEDNASTIDPEKLNALKAEISAQLKSDKAQCTKNVKSIQITSSSNLLANTGGKPQDRFNFKALSDNRAKKTSAELTKLFDGKNVPIKINSDGSNGNGSSGICPYEAVLEKNAVKIQMKKNFTDEEKENLEKSKFVKVFFEIEETGSGCNKNPAAAASNTNKPVNYAVSKRQQIKISCK